MAQKKQKKAKIFKIAFVAFFVYVVVSFVVMQVDISKRRDSLNEMQEELKSQQYLNKEIQGILDSGTDTDYIIRMAREKLGFVFPDERVFVDPNRKQ